MPELRFPPPWSVEETPACFVERDHDRQALAHVYCEDEPGAAQCGEAAHARRGAEDRRQRGQVAGVAAWAKVRLGESVMEDVEAVRAQFRPVRMATFPVFQLILLPTIA
jgi:hypothetical protein